MFYVEVTSQQHIAEFLDVPVSTVKNRLLSARAKLRERLVPAVGDASLADLMPSMEDCTAERVHRILDRLRRADASEQSHLRARHAGLATDEEK